MPQCLCAAQGSRPPRDVRSDSDQTESRPLCTAESTHPAAADAARNRTSRAPLRAALGKTYCRTLAVPFLWPSLIGHLARYSTGQTPGAYPSADRESPAMQQCPRIRPCPTSYPFDPPSEDRRSCASKARKARQIARTAGRVAALQSQPLALVPPAPLCNFARLLGRGPRTAARRRSHGDRRPFRSDSEGAGTRRPSDQRAWSPQQPGRQAGRDSRLAHAKSALGLLTQQPLGTPLVPPDAFAWAQTTTRRRERRTLAWPDQDPAWSSHDQPTGVRLVPESPRMPPRRQRLPEPGRPDGSPLP